MKGLIVFTLLVSFSQAWSNFEFDLDPSLSLTTFLPNGSLTSQCQPPADPFGLSQGFCFDCEIQVGTLMGFNNLNLTQNVLCDMTFYDKIVIDTYEPPSFEGCAIDEFSKETMFTSCQCIADKLTKAREDESFTEVPLQVIDQVLLAKQYKILSQVIDDVAAQTNSYKAILAEAGQPSDCDPFAEVRAMALNRQCGVSMTNFFLNKIGQSSAEKVADAMAVPAHAVIASRLTIDRQLAFRSGIFDPEETLSSEEDIEFTQMIWDSAYLANNEGFLAPASYERLTAIYEDFYTDIRAPGAASTTTRSPRTIIDKYTDELFELTVQVAQTHCEVQSKRLVDACNLARENKTIYDSDLFQNELEDDALVTNVDDSNNGFLLYSYGIDAKEYQHLQVMLTCESQREGLFDSFNTCVTQQEDYAGDLNNPTFIAACEQYSQFKGAMCHDIVEKFQSNDGFRAALVQAELVPQEEFDLASVMVNNDDCVRDQSKMATSIYNFVVENFDKDFSYFAPGTEIPESSAPLENPARPRARPIRDNDSDPTPSVSYHDPMAAPSVDVPMLPPEVSEKPEAANEVSDILPENLVATPYVQAPLIPGETLEEEGQTVEEELQASEVDTGNSDATYKALMAKIDSINSQLASRDRQIAEANAKMSNTTLSDFERQKIQLERERLQLERERLQLERKRYQDHAKKVVPSSAGITTGNNQEETAKTEVKPIPTNVPVQSEKTGKLSIPSAKNAATLPSGGPVLPSSRSIQDSSVGSDNGLTLSGIYVAEAGTVSEFFAGEKTFRQHKLVLMDPKNEDNVIVCFISPDVLEVAVKDNRQEFQRKDYLCGEPVSKNEIGEVAPEAPKVKKDNERKKVEEPAQDSSLFYETVKELTNK